jgi:opacity protein-like surface antigen
MKKLLLAVALLALTCTPALATDWSMGTNLGLTIVSPEEGDNVTAFALPGAVGGLQPGMRFGYVFTDKPQHELFVDTGLLFYSTENYSNNAFELTGNYQWNMVPNAVLMPYATAGFGFLFQSNKYGDETYGATSALFGLGFGVRRTIASGAGSLRAELRFDRITEAKDGDIIIVPNGNAFTVKLGYDLWLRR